MNAHYILDHEEEDYGPGPDEEEYDQEIMFRIALSRLDHRELEAVLFKLDQSEREIVYLEMEVKRLRKRLAAKKNVEQFGDIDLPDLP